MSSPLDDGRTLWDMLYLNHDRARSLVNKAVARGELEREPCLFCDRTPAQAHHHDYSQPLEVTWLCVRHHRMIHGRMRAPGGDGQPLRPGVTREEINARILSHAS